MLPSLIGHAAVIVTLLAAPLVHAQSVIDVGPGDFVSSGTVFPNGSTVNVTGGVIGFGVDLANGTLNISGGNVAVGATSIATGFTNLNNTVNVTGGNVGPFFQLFNGSVGNFMGGTLSTFGVFSGSSAFATGSTVTGFADVFSGGSFAISGGDVASFRGLAGSQIEIIGTEFAFGGVPIDIDPGESIVFTGRNQVLTATLADGSFFDHGLRSFDPGFPTPDVALSSSTLTLTRVVPSPSGLAALGLGALAIGVRRRRA